MSNLVGKQSIGKRSAQEDAFQLVMQNEQDPASDVLMILADGMGGHAGGEVASQLAIDTFAQHFVHGAQERRPRARLEECLHKANEALATRVAADPALEGMGCTLIGALRKGNRLSWVSVGDSLVYLYRNGNLRQVNADHSLYGELMELVKAGKMTQQEAASNPRRNALRSAVMGNNIALIDLETLELQKEDLIVIASDGLDTLSSSEISAILGREKRPDVRAICSDLLNAVDGKGSPTQDNTTIIVYRHAGDGRSTLSRHSRWGDLSEKRTTPTLPIVAGALALIAFCALIGLWLSGGSSNDTAATPPEPTAPVSPTDRPISDPATPEGADSGGNSISDGDTPDASQGADEADTPADPDTGADTGTDTNSGTQTDTQPDQTSDEDTGESLQNSPATEANEGLNDDET